MVRHAETARPPLVLSYLRFSRAEQLKGDSTRRQLDLSEQYAARRGWEIDKSLADKGVSAFRGANAATGALGSLLALVKAGKIPRGTVLLVECLDRLTRNEATEALGLFLNLIGAGIRIVTLGDGYEYEQGHMDMGSLMYSVMVLSRAHEESATKSKRLTEAWKAKRAAIGQKVLTRQLPAWLKVEGGRVVVDEAKAAVVRRIFRMVLDGYGQTRLVKTLNEEVPVIGGRCRHWVRSYISKILHNRAVLGEFQPHRLMHDGQGRKAREPVGDPVKGYYPAIVGEDEFYAAAHALAERKTLTGPNTKFVNLFKGLLYDSRDGSPMQVCRKYTRCYASASTLDGRKGAPEMIAVPVAPFEAAFLHRVSETASLDLDDGRVAELTGRLGAVAGKLQTVRKRVGDINAALADPEAGGDVGAMVKVVSKLTGEEDALRREHEQLTQQLAGAKMGTPAEAAEQIASLLAGSLSGLLKPDVRHTLQKAIRQLVGRIDCEPGRDGTVTRCRVTVTLRNGSRVEYVTLIGTRAQNEVVIEEADGTRTYIEVEGASVAGKGGLSLYVQDKVRRLWQQARRPAEIARECGLSVSQVYRLCADVPRLKAFRPASRWDGHTPKYRRHGKAAKRQ